MSQAQVNIVGAHLDRTISVLDMPFLFNDHDHVTRTVEGAVGKIISRKVHDKTGIKPLCYTYSGGYRVIGATSDIKSLEDLKNQPNFITTTLTSGYLFKQAGAEQTLTTGNATDRDVQDMNANGGAIETTLIRFTGKYVLKTNHSMFMTTILCGKTFWDSLSVTEKELFVQAGLETSRQERIWSLEDAANIEATAKEKGLTINSISTEETAELKKAAGAGAGGNLTNDGFKGIQDNSTKAITDTASTISKNQLIVDSKTQSEAGIRGMIHQEEFKFGNKIANEQIAQQATTNALLQAILSSTETGKTINLDGIKVNKTLLNSNRAAYGLAK
jgi:hypothetical protein